MSQASDPDSAFDRARSGFSKKVIAMTAGMVVAGCLSTTLFKYQTKRQGLAHTSISLQTFFVFVSQFLNLLFFFLKITWSDARLSRHFLKYRNRSYSNGRLYTFPSHLLAPSSLFSCAASLLQLYALFSLSSGFFQMLYGFGVLFAPLLAALFLRRTLYPHIKAGILICLLGFLITAASSYFLGLAGVEADGGWRAVFVMLAGVFCSSCQRVHQEYVHRRVEISPFRYSGLEGFYGSLILLAFHLAMAVFNAFSPTPYFDIAAELAQWYRSDELVWSSLLLVLCLSVYDLLGLALVSRIGATYRVSTEVIRVLFLWAIDVALYQSYQNTLRYWLNLGFIVVAYGCLVFGTLVINEVVELTCCGLNKYFGLYRQSEESADDAMDSGVQALPPPEPTDR